MSFISVPFAVFFLILAVAYHLSAGLRRNALAVQQVLLLVAGLLFYAWSGLRFVPFLVYGMVISYVAGLFARKRLLLALFLIADLAPLLFFKFCPQGGRSGRSFPLGLSFFTFQSVSYIVDCYGRRTEAERNPLLLALYVGFFPTLPSGPIQRASGLMPQLRTLHPFDYDHAADGMRLFAWGMFKKLCIADKIAPYVDFVYGSAGNREPLALLFATVLYSFQIYCDFSGYSDMAIGIARYLGFDVGENFRHPYLSQSVGAFWRRWHISLSSWLRDYVYIPLGGSRCALPRIYGNLLATFLVSGIWHGTGWHFIIWGLLHGLLLCIERATRSMQDAWKLPGAVRTAVTFCLVTFAWIFFRAGNLGEAALVIKGMAKIPQGISEFLGLRFQMGLKDALRTVLAFNSEGLSPNVTIMGLSLRVLLFAAVSLATRKTSGLAMIRQWPLVLRWAAYVVFCFLLVPEMASNTNTDFLYFAF